MTFFKLPSFTDAARAGTSSAAGMPWRVMITRSPRLIRRTKPWVCLASIWLAARQTVVSPFIFKAFLFPPAARRDHPGTDGQRGWEQRRQIGERLA